MSSNSFHNSCEPCFPNDCKHDSTKYYKNDFKQRFKKCCIIDINSDFKKCTTNYFEHALKHGFRNNYRMRIRFFAITSEQTIPNIHSMRVPQTRRTWFQHDFKTWFKCGQTGFQTLVRKCFKTYFRKLPERVFRKLFQTTNGMSNDSRNEPKLQRRFQRWFQRWFRKRAWTRFQACSKMRSNTMPSILSTCFHTAFQKRFRTMTSQIASKHVPPMISNILPTCLSSLCPTWIKQESEHNFKNETNKTISKWFQNLFRKRLRKWVKLKTNNIESGITAGVVDRGWAEPPVVSQAWLTTGGWSWPMAVSG